MSPPLRLHWSDCTSRALSDVILHCNWVEYPKHYLRLQAPRVQQQREYYRMVGILTASWSRREQQQQQQQQQQSIRHLSLSFAQNPLICSAALCKIPISLSFEAGRSSIFSPLCSAHHRACQLAMIVSMGKFHKSCMTMKRRGVGRADAKMVFGKKQCKW